MTDQDPTQNPIQDFIDALIIPKAEKHLQGKHNQASHGRRGGAAAGEEVVGSAPKAAPTGRDKWGRSPRQQAMAAKRAAEFAAQQGKGSEPPAGMKASTTIQGKTYDTHAMALATGAKYHKTLQDKGSEYSRRQYYKTDNPRQAMSSFLKSLDAAKYPSTHRSLASYSHNNKTVTVQVGNFPKDSWGRGVMMSPEAIKAKGWKWDEFIFATPDWLR